MGNSSVIWLSRKVVCRNGITEKTKYPARIPAGSTKRERKKEIARASRAADNAERELARWLNNNFDPQEDIHLALTYSEGGYERLQARADKITAGGIDPADALIIAAQRELENFVRRVQYAIGSEALRYVGISSDLNDTGERVRPHHHVIINREALTVCVKKWARMGGVLATELYPVNGDFTALAHYLINQVRYIPNAKRYTLSRNLMPPVVSAPVEVTRYAEAEITIPAGCLLLHRSPYTRGASQYVRYIDPAAVHEPYIQAPGAGGGTAGKKPLYTRSKAIYSRFERVQP